MPHITDTEAERRNKLRLIRALRHDCGAALANWASDQFYAGATSQQLIDRMKRAIAAIEAERCTASVEG
jgi:hypothetical protein